MIKFQSKPKAPQQPDATALLAWYDRHRRDLPWRARPGEAADPYRVWLSEIMLQQTTVKTVGPYFEKFTRLWPTVDALARADRDDILKAWAGLGYYSRARNLHACAQAVMEQQGGCFPSEQSALKSLPGIGDYSSAAISAIAFDRKATVVDGNVERVVARLFALETPMPAAKKDIKTHAGRMTPDERPGDYAQAMMDLGATICTPKRPACALCPFSEACVAKVLGSPEMFPVKAPKKAKPKREAIAFWVRRQDGAVLVRRRPEKGLLGGMTEIPSTPFTPVDDAPSSEWEGAPFEAQWRLVSGSVKHVFTHFELTMQVAVPVEFNPETVETNGDQWWSPGPALKGEALPTVMKKVVALAEESAL